MVCEGKRVCAKCTHCVEKVYVTIFTYTDLMCTKFATKKCDVITGEEYWENLEYCNDQRRKPRDIRSGWDKLMGKPVKLEDICGDKGIYFEEKK